MFIQNRVYTSKDDLSSPLVRLIPYWVSARKPCWMSRSLECAIQRVNTCRSKIDAVGTGGVKAWHSARGLGAPRIQGWARDPRFPAQPGHHAIVSTMCEHVGRPLRPLIGRARMRANHRFLPGVMVAVGASTIPPGLFLCQWTPQDCKVRCP